MSDFPSLDDFESGNTTAQPRMESVPDNDNDFLGSGNFASQSSKFPEIGESGDLLNANESFAQSFPAVEEPQAFSGMISGPSEPYIPGTARAETAAQPSSASADQEPEVISQWRERQAIQIQRRDEESARKKAETHEKARQAIDDFYDTYNAKRDKNIEGIRKEQDEFLAKRDETTSGGTSWERIVKLIDTKDSKAIRGDRDVSRMRELLLTLKKDKNAPSAGL